MNNLAKKLKLKGGVNISLFKAPKDFQKNLAPLPSGCKVVEPGKASDFIMLFVENRAELEREVFNACKTLNKEGLIWICYPKGTSGKQTDLTRDKGWEILEKLDMKWLSLVSLDDTWSAFCMKNVPKEKVNRTSEDYHHNVSKWTDPGKKLVKVPADLNKAMENGKVKEFFNSLAFTGRKEYVMWIVSAKQEKTRSERVAKAIQKLKEGKKMPL
jgi:hypothetical protein